MIYDNDLRRLRLGGAVVLAVFVGFLAAHLWLHYWPFLVIDLSLIASLVVFRYAMAANQRTRDEARHALEELDRFRHQG